MSILRKILYAVSVLQILHSGFSSYEFHKYIRDSNIPHLDKTIPSDIKFECYMGFFLFILATFLTIEKDSYYPVDSMEKKIITSSQYLKEIKLNKATNLDNLIGLNPTGNISNTPCIIDVHQKRKEFNDWAKNKGSD